MFIDIEPYTKIICFCEITQYCIVKMNMTLVKKENMLTKLGPQEAKAYLARANLILKDNYPFRLSYAENIL